MADDANTTENASELGATQVQPVQGEQLQSLMAARCAMRQRVAVLAARGNLITDGALVELDGDELTVELFSPTARQLRSQPAVTICFSDGTTAHSFFARVEAFVRATVDNPAAQLRVLLPELVVALSIPAARITRHSFRVPIIEDPPLTVTLRDDDGQVYLAKVQDISLGGMLLVLRQEVPQTLSPGAGLSVSLQTDRQELSLRAEVRSTEEREIGICFYTFGEGKELNPPPPYERFVSQLERQWLRTKRGQQG